MKPPAYNPEGFHRLRSKPCRCVCSISTYDENGNVKPHFHAIFLGRRAAKRARRQAKA